MNENATVKPMLRQIELNGVQNRPMKKNGLLPLTNSFLKKNQFEFKNLL